VPSAHPERAPDLPIRVAACDRASCVRESLPAIRPIGGRCVTDRSLVRDRSRCRTRRAHDSGRSRGHGGRDRHRRWASADVLRPGRRSLDIGMAEARPASARERRRITAELRPVSVATPRHDTRRMPSAGCRSDVPNRPRSGRTRTGCERSAPGRTRTCDARFRKPTLYPLSYEGGAGREGGRKPRRALTGLRKQCRRGPRRPRSLGRPLRRA
jgi:hypothetical protein